MSSPRDLPRSTRRGPAATWALLAVAVLATPACTAVSRDAYERDLAAMKQQTDWLEAQKVRQAEAARSWQAKQVACAGELAACRKNGSDLEDQLKSCQESLRQVANTGNANAQRIYACEQEKNTLRGDLVAAREEAVKLRAKLDAIQRQLQELRDSIGKVRGKLADLVRAGKLRVEVKNGFLVIGLESDILFDTGKATLKPEAEPVLTELAAVLRQFRDKRFQVAGHTDRRGGDAVNWRLSVDRSLSVVQFLIASGKVPAAMLSAGGYAHYLPAASADNEAGWKQNRRVELLLLPDLTALYRLAEEAGP
jgi:chemotaxis protein MotB